MHAVDTNVVVRLLRADDPEQFARAELLFRNERIWISMTVILEVAWVLRGGYKQKPQQVTAALAHLAGLPNVSVENAACLARAIALCDAGMDFADALHLSTMAAGATFCTFDMPMLRVAARLGLSVVVPV